MKLNSPPSTRGFSFIEVLIASAILSFVLLSLFHVFLQGSTEIHRTMNKSLAINLVKEMMEMIAASQQAIENYDGFSTTSTPANSNPVKEDLLRWKQDVEAFQHTALGTISVLTSDYRKTITITLDYTSLGKKDRIEIKRIFSTPSPVSP
ncbi:MAG: prepilin-type N-terminal cleavage/methylation domain-containing protein [Nitrospira sp.]|nr:prepilin-type N-terminal cleavage/methylation domain-containing protein [Nitrospira sp.]